MSTEYIEVNSAYRNRNQYPLASDFVVQIAQSGNKTAVSATDPVTNAYPQMVFTPFTTISGILAPNTSTLSNTSTNYLGVILSIPAGQASHSTDYYIGSVLVFTNGSTVERQRIRLWRYLNTVGGRDYFEVALFAALSTAQVANVSTFTLSDASNLSDSTHPILYIPESVSSENFYINYIIYNQTRNEWLPISFYDGLQTHLAQLNTVGATNYSGTWQLTDTYVLRLEPPMQYGQTIVGISLSSATIVPLTPNTRNGFYVGNFIRVLNTGRIVRITSYTASTNIITVYPYFTVVPNGLYEMLQFSYDNEGYLTFNNSFAAIREAVCYDITLMNIVLPNFTLDSAQGSRSIFYPYVYVEFRSEKNSDRQGSNSIISNNPNATRMLFRALLNDNVDPLISPFVRLDGNGMVQRIKLDPQSSYHFSVHLPDGSLFETVLPENPSPSPPNALAQISALFSFQRV